MIERLLCILIGGAISYLLARWHWKSTCDALVESISAHRQQSALDSLKAERAVKINHQLTEQLKAAKEQPVTTSKDSKWITLYQEKYVENAELKRQLKEARGLVAQ